MRYHDLRDFMRQLEAVGELKRIAVAVDPVLEMTEIADRVLRAGGPALLFENPKGHAMPVLANLFGTPQRGDRPQRYRLLHGDVVVWGGPARLAYHGVAPLAEGEHALLGSRRINLTFRHAA